MRHKYNQRKIIDLDHTRLKSKTSSWQQSYLLLLSILGLLFLDGPEAGQTVPHVHIHILPRKVGDFERNDIVYDLIEDKEKELKKKLDLDKERMDRTADEMAKEADELRALFWTYKSAY